jgi:hypothetical protein
MATVIRKERALPDSLANAPNRPFAAFEDRPYERAGRATKRSSADGVGCAGSDPRRSELRRQVNAKRGFARLRPGRLSVLLALTICRDPKKNENELRRTEIARSYDKAPRIRAGNQWQELLSPYFRKRHAQDQLQARSRAIPFAFAGRAYFLI